MDKEISKTRKMKIYLATDHAGFKLKESLKSYLLSEGYDVEDGCAF